MAFNKKWPDSFISYPKETTSIDCCNCRRSFSTLPVLQRNGSYRPANDYIIYMRGCDKYRCLLEDCAEIVAEREKEAKKKLIEANQKMLHA